MGARFMIEDSENEDVYNSAHNSPVREHGVQEPDTIEMTDSLVVNASLQLGTGSTDPILFQALYDEHLGGVQSQSGGIRDDRRSPIFEDAIINQSMSSSAIGARELKRRSTINVSSLTSVTEPTTSNRKGKRTKSMRELDDLTQITTPKTSKDNIEKDSWECPGGSSSDGLLNTSKKLTRRKTEKNGAMKTYGRPVRRSQTVVTISSSQSDDYIGQVAYNEEVSQRSDLERPSWRGDIERLRPTVPERKKRKRANLLDDSVSVGYTEEPLSTPKLDVSSASANHQNRSMDFATISSPLSTEEASNAIMKPPAHKTLRNSEESRVSKDSEQPLISLLPQTFQPSKSSIVIVPNILTEAEKLSYNVVSLSSSPQDHLPSLPHMMEHIDPYLKYTGESSTIPNDTTLERISSAATPTPASARLLPSSPPLPAAGSKMKRSKSEIVLPMLESSASSKSLSMVKKRKGRRKTIAPGETPPRRETSFDELSLEPRQFIDNSVGLNDSMPKRNARKRTRKETEEERISIDELVSTEEIGTTREWCQPLSRSRRARSISVDPPVHSIESGIPKPKAKRRKSNISEKTSITSEQHKSYLDEETTSLVGINQNDTSLVSESVNNTAHSLDADVPTVASAQPAPRRRGRSKKNPEDTENQQKEVSESHPSLHTEPAALRETSINEQEPTSTPKSNANTELVPSETTPKGSNATVPPAQTPSKEAKRCPDQHSPLQSGKMPYRVGLSKRMRIAPLLKIIRK